MQKVLFSAKKNFKIKSFGQSMQPILLDKDLMSIKKIDFSKIKVNDILIVNKNRKNFVHRVIYKSFFYIITKGDNNFLSDGRVYPKNIIGKVEKVEREKKYPKKGKVSFNMEDIYLLQSTLYFEQISNIKKKLESKNIDFIFLKGLPLHLYIEKTHPKRIYLDCDILVEKKDLPKIRKILNKEGYGESDTSISNIQRKLKDKNPEISFIKIVKIKETIMIPVILDIHLEIVFMMTQIGNLNTLYSKKLVNKLTENFLKEKKLIKIKSEIFPILSDENFIVYLALHFFHHNFRGAFRLDLLDKVVRNILRKNQYALKESFIKIKEYRLENFIYPVFLLLSKYYQTPVPKKCLNSILPNKKKLKFIKNNIISEDIFNGDERLKMGIKRFKNLFCLSPYPLPQKMLTFFNLQVIYLIFWVYYKKLKVALLSK